MVAYNLRNSSAQCGRAGHWRETVQEILNTNNTKWFSAQHLDEKIVNWALITFRKPLIINGFGIKSASDND